MGRMGRMGRPWQMEWQEDAETLAQLYKAEQDLQKRTRLHALWLLRRGKSQSETAALVGVSLRSVQKWVSWYRQGGLSEVLSKQHGGHAPVQTQLSGEQIEALRAEADAGHFRSLAEAVNWVQERFGIGYSYWGMRSLFHRFKIKKKVPRPSNPKASVEEQEAWKKGGSATG